LAEKSDKVNCYEIYDKTKFTEEILNMAFFAHQHFTPRIASDYCYLLSEFPSVFCRYTSESQQVEIINNLMRMLKEHEYSYYNREISGALLTLLEKCLFSHNSQLIDLNKIVESLSICIKINTQEETVLYLLDYIVRYNFEPLLENNELSRIYQILSIPSSHYAEMRRSDITKNIFYKMMSFEKEKLKSLLSKKFSEFFWNIPRDLGDSESITQCLKFIKFLVEKDKELSELISHENILNRIEKVFDLDRKTMQFTKSIEKWLISSLTILQELICYFPEKITESLQQRKSLLEQIIEHLGYKNDKIKSSTKKIIEVFEKHKGKNNSK